MRKSVSNLISSISQLEKIINMLTEDIKRKDKIIAKLERKLVEK